MPSFDFNSVKTFKDLVFFFISIINIFIIPILIGLSLVAFLYGIYKFIMSSGEETKRKEGKDFMLYGIVGIFVMISVWSLVKILTNTFNFKLNIPQFKQSKVEEYKVDYIKTIKI